MRFKSILVIAVALALLPLAALAQPGRLVLPDFSALAKKATQSVNVSLDATMLGLAGGALGAVPNEGSAKDLLKGLQGIYVRSFIFDRDGAYSRADVDAVRAQLVAPAWGALVSADDRQQHSDVDIYVRRNGDRTEGLAIIAAQPRQFTIVNLVGSVDLAKLAALQGRFGIPVVSLPTMVSPSTVVTSAPPSAYASSGGWQPHRYRFEYLSSNTIYGCQGLADKLRFLLSTMDPRDVHVNPVCFGNPGLPERAPEADLRFQSLKPPAAGKSAADAGATPPGVWRKITWTPGAPRTPLTLGRGDCTLVQEVIRSVLPMFSIRNLHTKFDCGQYRDVGSFSVSFEVFAPARGT